jgi:tungstate transport system ATP-binding protein
MLLDRLEKKFGGRRLLDISSLVFPAGELNVVVGDNGAGKTTLLKILAGLETADQLALRFNGTFCSQSDYPDALRRQIVYVHQHPYLFSTSVAANIGYGLKIRAVPPEVRERAIREAMAWAHLSGVEHIAPRRLSGGEKQRVALARALVLNAPVMLIDEPTANLDANARDLVKTMLESLRAEGRIVVISTHDTALFNLPGATVWTLADGKVTRPN